MSHPRVTVLMSVYNGEAFVRQAVESVLNQTFKDFEFLIFDDKSTDASLAILEVFTDKRMHIVANPENLGLTRNLVAGMSMARGEFIARMDADDICVPDRLEQQLRFLEGNPDVGVLGSAVTFFDDNGMELLARQPLEHEEIKCALFYGFTMLHPSVMIRVSALKEFGLNYDPEFRVSQDHDLWTRAVRKVRFANLANPLLRMREHGAKLGRTRKELQISLSDRIRRRQLEELGFVFDARQLRLFCEQEAGPCAWNCADVEGYDELLKNIFRANSAARIFDQKTLVETGVVGFRSLCRQLLMAGNPAGRYYWRSETRRLDTPTTRALLGMAFRSVFLGRGLA